MNDEQVYALREWMRALIRDAHPRGGVAEALEAQEAEDLVRKVFAAPAQKDTCGNA